MSRQLIAAASSSTYPQMLQRQQQALCDEVVAIRRTLHRALGHECGEPVASPWALAAKWRQQGTAAQVN